MEAARIGAPGAAWTLLAFGAEPTLTNSAGVSALSCAAVPACTELVGFFVRAGCSVHETTRDGLSVLRTCCSRSHPGVADCIRILVEAGAPVDERYAPDQQTALHQSATVGNPQATRALIEAGASINAEDRLGRTPLNVSATPEVDVILRRHGGRSGRYGRITAYEEPLVLEYGIDALAIHDDPGLTAILNGDGQKLVAELERLPATPPYLPAPFHLLVLSRAHWDKTEVARMLLTAGVNLERRDPGGKTALHLALVHAQDLALALLDLGADLADPGATEAARVLIELFRGTERRGPQCRVLLRLVEDLERRLGR